MFDGCVAGTVGLWGFIVNPEREDQMLSERCDLGLQRVEGITVSHSTLIFSPSNLLSSSVSLSYLDLSRKVSLRCLLFHTFSTFTFTILCQFLQAWTGICRA